MTLALKPAIVFPPGHPANQAAQSEREREWKTGRERKGALERGRDGCHGYFPGDASTLVYLLVEGACTAGPLTEQMCMCACLCVHGCLSACVCVGGVGVGVGVGVCAWLNVHAQTHQDS